MAVPDRELATVSNGIGTLAEKSLHAAVKEWYGRAGDQYEVEVDGFIIDIVRGEQLVEIQTRNLYALKRKLRKLLDHYCVHLLHPIAQEKWIVRQTADGQRISRRKSPKRGQVLNIFDELIRIPHLLPHPNLTIGVLLTQQEEIWRDDGQGSWRRKRWSVYDCRLLDVVEYVTFASPADFYTMLPPDLPQPFTSRELSQALKCYRGLAQKMAYTLRKTGGLVVTGKQGNAFLYEVSSGQK